MKELATGGERALPILFELLKDDDPELWEVASAVLGTTKVGGEQAVRELLRALRRAEGHPSARMHIVHALGGYGADAKQSIVDLMRLLGAPESSRLQVPAAMALAKIGAPAVPALLQGLRSDSESLVHWSAYALAQIGEKDAIPILVSFLSLSDSRSTYAKWALEDFGPEARKALLGELNSKCWKARSYAIDILAKADEFDDVTIKAFVHALDDDTRAVRWSAVVALGKVGRRGIPGLIRATRDRTVRVRLLAITLLSDCRPTDHSDIVPALFSALMEDPSLDVQIAADKALIKFREESPK